MAEYISFQPKDFFTPFLYTGTGSTNALTGVGFQPDLVWMRDRDTTSNNVLVDSARGVTKVIYSNDTDDEVTTAESLNAFGADGFTVGSNSLVNNSGDDIVAWNWKGGTTSGITTDGSTTITPSAYSFSQTAGFSVVAYTGNDTSGAKVAHGLGAVPEVIIVKARSTGEGWCSYWSVLGNTKYMILNTNAASATATNRWNDTDPDSVNFTLGNETQVNGSGHTYVAYCFASKKGYSKFSNYIGNGNADGTFVYTGFRPAYVVIKRTDSTASWYIWDNKRDTYNVLVKRLRCDTNQTESENASYKIDFLANGFKLRQTASELNGSGGDMLYFAFAEFPLVSSNDISGLAW